VIHIDEKFKDCSPEKTVENIINILDRIGVKLEETWYDSGIDNCYSLRVTVNGKFPGTNGKGVTPALARASAYGEFIERLQLGLFFYKYQSFENDPELFMNSYAPDAKCMTKDELVQNGERMDYIIDTYGGRLSREELAEQCEMYAGSDKIITVPFYSLFEDKYVQLPAAFVEHIYCSNGCCAGNTKEEAVIHALSEILERHSTIQTILSGEAVPVIPDEVLDKYDTVKATIEALKKRDIDVTVLDFSHGIDFPIVASRLINKKTGGYIMSIGADPVLEIAIKRTLTEVLQGKNVSTLMRSETNGVISSVKDVNSKHNVLNQIETGNGYFTIDFFSDDLKAKRPFKMFTDSANKTNLEIIPQMLSMFKKMGRPVYIRNYSYLGFPCYMVVVPGYSESRGVRLNEFLQEYSFADRAASCLRYIEKATDDELAELLLFSKMISGARSRQSNYQYLAGIPFVSNLGSACLIHIHMAYANLRLNKPNAVIQSLSDAAKACTNEETKNYITCLRKYFEFKNSNVPQEQIMYLLKKFCTDAAYNRFAESHAKNSLFEGLLMRCDKTNCDTCKYKDSCHVSSCKDLMRRIGKAYGEFADGQAKENFNFGF